MKPILVIAFLLTTFVCFAQKQNTYYLKNDGSYVSVKDEADYIRIVREPDAGSDLYNVLEFYKNGEQLLIGKSSKVSPIVFEGQVARFYPTGKKMQLANYHNNHLTGLFYDYYPNGKIFSVREYSGSTNETSDDYRIISCLDTTGNLLVNEGNGHYFGYFGGDGIMEEGDVKGGFRVGDWKGSFRLIGVKFEEHYDQGRLVSGTAISKDGNKHSYTQRFTHPYYRDGNKALYKFLENQINYLGKNNAVNVNGTAIISFFVDVNRKIENIKIQNSSSEAINNYLTEAMVTSAKGWVPASSFGVPQKEPYSFPFSLKTEDNPIFY